MEKNDDMLIRRKRIDEMGEWEYECRECEKWLPKEKFKGCRTYVDAYGNCLMCASCRSKKANSNKIKTENEWKEYILTNIGFYDFPDSESFMKHLMEKHQSKKK